MKQKKNIFKLFKAAVVVLALCNLIALFVFQYELPGIPAAAPKETSDIPEDVGAAESASEETAYSFAFDEDPLVYDGTSRLDLLDGVSIISPDGPSTADAKIFAHIKTGTSVSKKIIEYSADTADGRISAQRNLELTGYKGPSIKCPDSLPQMETSQLDSVLALLPSDGSFSADDGFGNDITASVKASWERDASDSNLIHFTFSVTNSFNDTVSAQRDFTLIRTKPIIALSESAVTIDLNSAFNALNYVTAAEDVDGTSLFQTILINGTVNTQEAGEYVLTYTASSPSGAVSDPAELIVTVK